jgi:hypothetical protein
MENETIRLIYVLLMLPYCLFIVWLGVKLFTKWIPLVNKVKDVAGEDSEFPIFDLGELTKWERMKFFYVRMIIEVGVIMTLVILGVSRKPKAQYVINKHMWRGNWAFLGLLLCVSGIFVLPMCFML